MAQLQIRTSVLSDLWMPCNKDTDIPTGCMSCLECRPPRPDEISVRLAGSYFASENKVGNDYSVNLTYTK